MEGKTNIENGFIGKLGNENVDLVHFRFVVLFTTMWCRGDCGRCGV